LYYAKWKIHQHFQEVNISGNYQEKNLPVLIISNHLSWWDGIWVMYLNIKLLKRRFHFMMLDDQIKKYRISNLVGGYSVKKRSKSIMESLKYTLELLSDYRNMVLLFPQGKIQSLYTPTIQFENGIDHILKRLNDKAQVLFLVNLVDYMSNTKPSLYMYFQEYSVNFEPGHAQEAYNSFYKQCMTEHLNKTDEG
jgi:hypothetical protein